MPDPKLKRTHVQIEYSSSDGYSAKFAAKAGEGAKHLKTGDPVPPQHALIAGLEHLAQIAALFGFEAEALEAVDQAISRVAEYRAQRGGRPLQEGASRP